MQIIGEKPQLLWKALDLCVMTLIMSSAISQMFISMLLATAPRCHQANGGNLHELSAAILRWLQLQTHLNRNKNKQVGLQENLTLHADFVLPSARVRDEVHLHRHLPHRSIGWLSWTHTKRGELERVIMNITQNGGVAEKERERERSENRERGQEWERKDSIQICGCCFFRRWGIQELIQKLVL